ncbi:MAG: hypothetical protein GEU73_05625 [Chloroflexi bacterium]|nr:hypothetical protein [Chloroflexota bacterium]
MPRSSEEMRKALGANQPVPVRTQLHGPFGVLHLQAELAERLHTGGGAGRPSDPAWTIRRLVGFRPDTWRALTEIAARLSSPRRRVSPGQVAASLIEDSVAKLRESSTPLDGEPHPGRAGRRRKSHVS